jgi:hypothetical protein
MIRTSSTILALLLSVSFLWAQAVTLSGTVTKTGGTAGLPGVKVTLAKAAYLSATTDAQGAFSITGDIVSIQSQTPQKARLNYALAGNTFIILSGLQAVNGRVELYSSSGRKIASVPFKGNAAGKQSVTLPELGSGLTMLRIITPGETITRTIVRLGDAQYLKNAVSDVQADANFSLAKQAAAVAVDTLIATKTGYTTGRATVSSYNAQSIAISLDSASSTCTLPNLPEGSALTVVNAKLPDPFMFYNGTRMTKKSEWPCRRKEILAMAQKYIYGPTPEVNPADVTGTISGGTVTAQIKVNGASKSVSFSIGSGSGKILNVSYGSGIAPTGCRTWDIQNTQMDSYMSTIQSTYGKAAGCRVMAAVWAVNVVCAVIDQNPTGGIDYVMTTGCSASAKSAFVTGAFCEGVDLTVIVESGGIGAANYRMCEWFRHGGGSSMWKCADDKPQSLDNTDNGSFSGAPYFSTSVASWVASTANIKNITKLPYDQHCLLACTAPRALCHFTNQNGKEEWCHLGGTCEALSAWAAEPVWNALGVPDNMGFEMYTDGTSAPGHCSNPASATALAGEFFKRVFQGDKTAKTDVMLFGKGDSDLQQPQADWKAMWVDWDMATTLQ